MDITHYRNRVPALVATVIAALFLVSSHRANAAIPDCEADYIASSPCLASHTTKKRVARKTFRRGRSITRQQPVHSHHTSRRIMRVTRRSVKTHCFPAKLLDLIATVKNHYGKTPVVTSGYRSRRYNRRVGGAKRSEHLHCKAVDFRVPGVNKYALTRYVKTLPGVGGVGSYCGSSYIHMDIGQKRSWHWGCAKGKKRKNRRVARRKTRKAYRARSHRSRRKITKQKKWHYQF